MQDLDNSFKTLAHNFELHNQRQQNTLKRLKTNETEWKSDNSAVAKGILKLNADLKEELRVLREWVDTYGL